MIPKAIKNLQCSGCVNSGEECYSQKSNINISCHKHLAGTTVLGQGKILLGFPKGFNILGQFNNIEINVYNSFEDMNREWGFDLFNVPVWKFLDENNNTFIRGICPRITKPFIHVVLENCLDKIECLNITVEDLAHMS